MVDIYIFIPFIYIHKILDYVLKNHPNGKKKLLSTAITFNLSFKDCRNLKVEYFLLQYFHVSLIFNFEYILCQINDLQSLAPLSLSQKLRGGVL